MSNTGHQNESTHDRDDKSASLFYRKAEVYETLAIRKKPLLRQDQFVIEIVPSASTRKPVSTNLGEEVFHDYLTW